MLRWVPRLMFAALLLCAVGVFAANALGALVKNDVLMIGGSLLGSDRAEPVRFYDLQAGLNVRFAFPVENLQSVRFWNGEENQFLLAGLQEEVYREGNRITYRERQHSISLYDMDTRASISLLDYSVILRRHRGPGPSAFVPYNLYNNLYPLVNPETRMLTLLDTQVDKLFVYDMEDSYRHLYTIPIAIETSNTSIWPGGVVQWSPDGQQFAAYYRPGTLLIFNIDGSNRRFYRSPGRKDFVPSWSPDGRYILLSEQGQGRQNRLSVLNVETGEWLPDVLDIIGMAPQWICKGQWIEYHTYSSPPNVKRHTHLLNVESGRIIHFADHPVLSNYEISELWTTDCRYLYIVTGTTSNAVDSDSPVFLATMDLSEVRLLHPNTLRYFYTIEDNNIIYYAHQDDGSTAIFSENLAGTEEPELLGTLPPDVDYISTYLEPYKRGIFIQYGNRSNFNSMSVYVLNLQTGERSLITNVENTISTIAVLYPGG